MNIDGSGTSDVGTGIRFLDHMLGSLATHSLIDITAKASGDFGHHVFEDIAICLGEALLKAIGDASGMTRFGYAIVPMDCTVAFAAVDLARRPYAKIDLQLSTSEVENLPRQNINHFLETLAMSLRANVHIWIEYGMNDHHKVEAAFKALALSLKQATSIDPRRRGVPSSKGAI